METIIPNDGKVVKKFEKFRFFDSFKTMKSSLRNWLKICQEIVLGNLLLYFLTYLQQNWSFSSKGFYPHSYVSCREKFNQKSLPHLNEWRNTLKGNAITITHENLDQAKRMWNSLNCQTLQDYHDAYLKSDCALPACVCGLHWELIFFTYKLDCEHFYTLPNMAKESSMQICKAKVELLHRK